MKRLLALCLCLVLSACSTADETKGYEINDPGCAYVLERKLLVPLGAPQTAGELSLDGLFFDGARLYVSINNVPESTKADEFSIDDRLCDRFVLTGPKEALLVWNNFPNKTANYLLHWAVGGTDRLETAPLSVTEQAFEHLDVERGYTGLRIKTMTLYKTSTLMTLELPADSDATGFHLEQYEVIGSAASIDTNGQLYTILFPVPIELNSAFKLHTTDKDNYVISTANDTITAH